MWSQILRRIKPQEAQEGSQEPTDRQLMLVIFPVTFFSNTLSVFCSVMGSRVWFDFFNTSGRCLLFNDIFLHMDPGTTVLGKSLVHIDGLSSSFTICLSFVWVAIWKFCGWFSLDVFGISSLACCFVFITLGVDFFGFFLLYHCLGFSSSFIGTRSAGIWYWEREMVQKLLVHY